LCAREKVVFNGREEFSSTAHLKRKLSIDSQPVVNLVTPGKKPGKRSFDSESESDSESELEEEEEVDAMKDIGCVVQSKSTPAG